jgi:uncharacterized membrane protein
MTLVSVLWAIAFDICPQRPSHSLFLGGQQMPIEARMAGIFGHVGHHERPPLHAFRSRPA